MDTSAPPQVPLLTEEYHVTLSAADKTLLQNVLPSDKMALATILSVLRSMTEERRREVASELRRVSLPNGDAQLLQLNVQANVQDPSMRWYYIVTVHAPPGLPFYASDWVTLLRAPGVAIDETGSFSSDILPLRERSQVVIKIWSNEGPLKRRIVRVVEREFFYEVDAAPSSGLLGMVFGKK